MFNVNLSDQASNHVTVQKRQKSNPVLCDKGGNHQSWLEQRFEASDKISKSPLDKIDLKRESNPN